MLMTSSRPKMMVRPSATSTTATPSASPVIICGARTNWIYSSNPIIRPHRCDKVFRPPALHRRWKRPAGRLSKPLAIVGTDGLLPADISDDLELSSRDPHNIHRLDGLMIACAHRLLALRGHPLQATHGFAHLVGLGRVGLLDRGLVEINQAIAIGAVEVWVGLVGRLEGL